MSAKATVTYFHHSGFTVAVEDTLLVFDYWRGENGALDPTFQLTDQDFEGFSQVIVLVSHDHEDHFDEVIYTWKAPNLTYLVAWDFPNGKRGKRMRPGDEVRLGDVVVHAYDSTDRGVSFLVTVGGLNIFHAGDLNLWHWREESTLRQIAEAEERFNAAMAPIEQLHIDIAMFPLDPRMGGMFDAGANHFIMAVKPRVFIPMHWFGRAEVALDYVRRTRTKYTETLALTQPRERVQISFDEAALTIRTFAPARQPRPEVSLDALSAVDPFSESDLPVQFNDGQK